MSHSRWVYRRVVSILLLGLALGCVSSSVAQQAPVPLIRGDVRSPTSLQGAFRAQGNRSSLCPSQPAPAMPGPATPTPSPGALPRRPAGQALQQPAPPVGSAGQVTPQFPPEAPSSLLQRQRRNCWRRGDFSYRASHRRQYAGSGYALATIRLRLVYQGAFDVCASDGCPRRS